MEEIIRLMRKRAEVLRKELLRATAKARAYPEGRLRVSNSCGQRRYYRMLEKADTTGDYLPVSEKELIGDLAQNRSVQIKRRAKNIAGFNITMHHVHFMAFFHFMILHVSLCLLYESCRSMFIKKRKKRSGTRKIPPLF